MQIELIEYSYVNETPGSPHIRPRLTVRVQHIRAINFFLQQNPSDLLIDMRLDPA